MTHSDRIRYLIFLLLVLFGFLLSTQCHAQRINTPHGYEYHDRFFTVEVDTTTKHIGVIMYFRGKHWVTIKSGAYAVDHSRIYWGKKYSWYYEGVALAISIEITGKHNQLNYNIR
jgi:hypothetical protein